MVPLTSLAAVLAVLSLGTVPCVSTTGEDAARGSRPDLSGAEQVVVSDDGFFALHYTHEGVDRVQSVADLDDNGLVDVLDDALVGLERARVAYRERGYRELVRDHGGGGGPELDVYIVDLANNGFANAVPAEEEAEPWSCYIRLAADLTSGTTALLDSVAAHELNHCVQYRYTTDSSTWMYESAATFEQYGLYESGLLDLALQVLWGTRINGARRPLDDVGNRFEYAGFSWWKFWNEYQPAGERMVPLWEALAVEPRWQQTLNAQAGLLWSLDLPAVFLEYATWNSFACARDDGQHYDPATMACVLETIEVPVTPLAVGEESVVVLDPGDYTSATLELSADGGGQSPALSCEVAGAGAEVLVRLIALDEFGGRGAHVDARAESSEQIELRLDDALVAAGRALVVIASVGDEAASLTCTASFVEPLVEEGEATAGCQCSTMPERGGTGVWVALACLFLALGLCRRSPTSASSGSDRGPLVNQPRETGRGQAQAEHEAR